MTMTRQLSIPVAAGRLHGEERVHGLVLACPGLPGYRWTTPRPPDQAAQVARKRGIVYCLHRAIPGARRHELAGTGHLLNLEQAATFNHHVPGFLTHPDGPAPALRRTGSDSAAHR